MQFQRPFYRILRNLATKNSHINASLSNFQSSLSLKNLYPESVFSITTPVKVPEADLKFNGYIPIEKVNVTYSRSSGPGGQHVNTTNTKVDIRFHLESADWLDDEVKRKLATMHKSRINKDGYFVVRSDKTRSQIYNQADAFTILREMLYMAAKACVVAPPSEETLLMIRKRKERANMQRLTEKRSHSLKKANRQVPDL